MHVGIGAVEEATGIARETLRAWERRYGFPQPVRSASGERQYQPEDVLRLQLIRQLLNNGQRPRHIVPMPIEDLRQLVVPDTSTDSEFLERGRSVLQDVLEMLRKDGARAVEEWLELELASNGLHRFIIRIAHPLAHAVGEAWSGGSLRVFEEHIVTSLMVGSIEFGIRSLPKPSRSAPTILLATIAPEEHTFGLLMVRGLLALSRAACLWVGSEMSVEEVARCAAAHKPDVVALSFSQCFPRVRAREDLKALRAQLGSSVQIWAGGACVRSLPELPGIVRMMSLEDAMAAVSTLTHARRLASTDRNAH